MSVLLVLEGPALNKWTPSKVVRDGLAADVDFASQKVIHGSSLLGVNRPLPRKSRY